MWTHIYLTYGGSTVVASKKRKARGSARKDNAKKPKGLRGGRRAGRLAVLMDMPLDIFYEVPPPPLSATTRRYSRPN